MPCEADAIEQCQPCCLQQHPLVTGATLAAATGTCIFGGAALCCAGISRWWAVFARLAVGRVGMGCCSLARGVQNKAITLL